MEKDRGVHCQLPRAQEEVASTIVVFHTYKYGGKPLKIIAPRRNVFALIFHSYTGYKCRRVFSCMRIEYLTFFTYLELLN